MPFLWLEKIFLLDQASSDKFWTYLKLIEESQIYLKTLSLKSIIPIIHYYRNNIIKDDSNFLWKFNEKQKVLYELDI